MDSWRSTGPSLSWKITRHSWWTSLPWAIFFWLWAATTGRRADKGHDLQGGLSSESRLCLIKYSFPIWFDRYFYLLNAPVHVIFGVKVYGGWSIATGIGWWVADQDIHIYFYICYIFEVALLSLNPSLPIDFSFQEVSPLQAWQATRLHKFVFFFISDMRLYVICLISSECITCIFCAVFDLV